MTTTVPTLYDYELSAECYAVRLFLAIRGVAHRVAAVDVYPGREHEGAAFRSVNPRGQVPTLVDRGVTVARAQPILVHLAVRDGSGGPWFPMAEPGTLVAILGWFECADDLAATAGLARLAASLFVPADIEACRAGAHRVLRDLERHLWFAERDGHAWLVPGTGPTLADIAVFPHVILCEEGGVGRQDYPAVRRWTDRVKRVPGFTAMPGVFPAGPA